MNEVVSFTFDTTSSTRLITYKGMFNIAKSRRPMTENLIGVLFK